MVVDSTVHARTRGNLVPGNLVRGLVSTQGAWYGPGMLKGLPGLRLASIRSVEATFVSLHFILKTTFYHTGACAFATLTVYETNYF